jgi:hypothetical protein
MAEMLKRQYDIVVLKVELLDTAPNVRFTLQAKVDGQLTDVRSWKSDTSDMGFPRRERREPATYRDVTGNLPGEMIQAVGDWLASNTVGNRPLWVHLVKPYGVLRFVPWERALGNALPVPILMLPDFIFPPPRESSHGLDVALCGSAPLDFEGLWVLQAMRDVSHCVLEASARRTRLHIFADVDHAQLLRDEYMGEGRLNNDVFVHSPEKAAPYLEPDASSRLVDQTGRLRSPWLLWMRDALRGQSVDIVHFCCHGLLTRDRGALLFAESPLERTRRYVAGPVSQVELGTFLTQVGAWSAAFTSVFDNNSEPGLRALADEVAQTRPGPLLMNTVTDDPAPGVLVEAYRFLYSVEPADAPKSSSLFMYCQPYRVRTKAVDDDRRRTRGSSAHTAVRNPVQARVVERVATDESPLEKIFDTQDTILPWVASTERFAEQVQLRFQQSARDEQGTDPEESQSVRHEVALDTVNKLRSAVARIAADDIGGGATGGGVA